MIVFMIAQCGSRRRPAAGGPPPAATPQFSYQIALFSLLYIKLHSFSSLFNYFFPRKPVPPTRRAWVPSSVLQPPAAARAAAVLIVMPGREGLLWH